MSMPRILIVEDENDVRDFLVRALHRIAPTVQVTAVENGALALERFKEQPYNLILTDQRMPVMRGIDMLRTLRSWGEAVPIVFITADVIVEEQAMMAGANAVYFKPVSISQIREIIQHWL